MSNSIYQEGHYLSNNTNVRELLYVVTIDLTINLHYLANNTLIPKCEGIERRQLQTVTIEFPHLYPLAE